MATRRAPSRRLWLTYAVLGLVSAAPMLIGTAGLLWRRDWWFAALVGGLAAAFVLFGLGCLRRATNT